ncbi:GNAT family N-acetyltransferase [Candidatus Sumerlaeota bacterium]|nr:GNAT family N-acetyltransferase [Candidatus Sumerlaeota bacterium]
MIQQIRPATNDEWDDFVSRNCHATYFHSRTWYEMVAHARKLRLTPKLILLDEKRRVLLPLASAGIAGGLWRHYISSPLGTYGGYLVEGAISEQDRAAMLEFIASLRCYYVRDNPFHPLLKECAGSIRNDFTQALDLEQPLEQLISGMNRKQIPRKVRIADRNQLQLRKIGRESIEDYYNIYKSCINRWDRASSLYNLNFLRDVCLSEGCDFWGVFTPSDQLVCAGPFLKMGRHVVSWLAIADTDALTMKPYEFLYFNLIQYYKQAGYKWFDFNPSGGHEGVVKFKESFGAQQLSCPVVTMMPPIAKGYVTAQGKMKGALRRAKKVLSQKSHKEHKS